MKKIIIMFLLSLISSKTFSNEKIKKQIEFELDKEKNIICEINEKINPLDILSKKNKGDSQIKKVNFCIKKSDILKLKIPNKLDIPVEMLNQIKGCKSRSCIGKKAGSEVYKTFVQRGQTYHAMNPGDMIIGMAWFEIMYNVKLEKIQKTLKNYENNNYKGLKKFKKKKDERKLFGLIKMNEGRIKMREALGFTMYDNPTNVIESQLLLGNFLNKDELEIDINPLMPDLYKRKILLEKYKNVLTRYKAKLEEEKNKKNEVKN